MATIRKRGEGQYHVQIRKRGYPTQTKTFSKEADARRWATIIESEMERGVFVSRNWIGVSLCQVAFQLHRCASP